MSEDNNKRPIVIKRIKKVAGGHHGGAWKIAYADFVTAMMAFFLLMWLISSTTKDYRQGISDFFKTPLVIALSGGDSIGDRTSVIKGGGADLSRVEGQVKEVPVTEEKKAIDPKLARQEVMRLERQKEVEKLKDIKATIEKAIESNPKLNKYKDQILLDITTEGLRILIVDDKNRPMFQIGSAKLEAYTHVILREIGKMLNEVPNKVSISGHTDATVYSAGDKGYSNWELSSDRANASRRELIYGGMADGKIVRVVGLSSAVLLDPSNPLNPINRRISLIVMNKKAEEAAKHDGGTIGVAEVNDAQDLQDSIQDKVESAPQIKISPLVPGVN